MHKWPHLIGCTHEEVVDSNGARMNPFLVGRPGFHARMRRAPYPCPACAAPEEGHPYIATRPGGLNPTAPAFTPVASEVLSTPNSIANQQQPSQHHIRPAPHRKGAPCPDNDSRCHWHHSTTTLCHLYWANCEMASKSCLSDLIVDRGVLTSRSGSDQSFLLQQSGLERYTAWLERRTRPLYS